MLASIGMSPAQAVRLLCQRAAEHDEGLERAQADMLVASDVRLIAKATVPTHTPAGARVLLQG